MDLVPGGEARSQRSLLFDALAAVQGFYTACLGTDTGRDARSYLDGRGLGRAIDSFGLGYAPPQSAHLLAFAARRGFTEELLMEAGVVVRGADGAARDRMRGRVVFPILDETERVVAFGGRILQTPADRELPKYLNSPETPLFNKRRLLFALSRARKAGHKRLLVMEGYTDVIASHLAGVTNAVATLGTSLTPDHARLLRRQSPDGIVLLFDGDPAGRAAAERAIAELGSEDLPVQVAIMAGQKDPADLVQTEGPAALERIVAGSRDALDFKLDAVRQRNDPATDVGVARCVEECLELVRACANPVRREAMTQRVAASFHLSAETLRRRLEAVKPRAARASSSGPAVVAAVSAPLPPGRRSLAEQELVAALIKDPSLLGEVPDGLLEEPVSTRILAVLGSLTQEGPRDPARIIVDLMTSAGDDPTMAAGIADLVAVGERITDPAEWVKQNMGFLTRDNRQRTLVNLRTDLREAEGRQDTDRVLELKKQIFEQLRQNRT
jgi:DNA primase